MPNDQEKRPGQEKRGTGQNRKMPEHWRGLVAGAAIGAGLIGIPGLLMTGFKISVKEAFVSVALIIIAVTIARAFGAIYETQNDRAMPSWLMRLVYNFAIISLMVLGVTFLTSGEMKHLAAVLAGMAAAFGVGALIGFIFGIPRALQVVTTPSIAATGRTYAPNTNLERISEWLTGIIIGLTLAQFGTLQTEFLAAATAFGESMGVTQPFIPGALLIFYSVAGFLLAYLWTRLRLLNDLSQADDAAREEPEYLEGLMYAYLYVAAPLGFRMALEKGKEYRTHFRLPNVRVLLYFACAYGQQHAYLTKKFKSSEEAGREAVKTLGVDLREAVMLAHDAIEECLLLDIGQYKLLRSLADPEDLELADDDLESLWYEPSIQALFERLDPAKRNSKTSGEKPPPGTGPEKDSETAKEAPTSPPQEAPSAGEKS